MKWQGKKIKVTQLGDINPLFRNKTFILRKYLKAT